MNKQRTYEKWEVLLGATFSVQIVKPSGWHCTDGHLTSRVATEDRKTS